jgi:hypothetical protein
MAYATVQDLTGWLTGSDLTPPTGAKATHMLDRATDLVDEHVLSGYDADDAGNPTNPDVIAALRDAVCAQVEQWLSVGEDNDTDGYPRGTGMSAPGVSTSARPARLAPRARAKMNRVGLLTARPF